MSADPHFLDSARRVKAQPHEHNRLQVRLDVPGGVTFAPDQLFPHNATKRVFQVPRLPEPSYSYYNFEREICQHNGVPYVPSSAFILGDEDELTPSQKLAQEVREKEGIQTTLSASTDTAASTPKNEEKLDSLIQAMGLNEPHDQAQQAKSQDMSSAPAGSPASEDKRDAPSKVSESPSHEVQRIVSKPKNGPVTNATLDQGASETPAHTGGEQVKPTDSAKKNFEKNVTKSQAKRAKAKAKSRAKKMAEQAHEQDESRLSTEQAEQHQDRYELGDPTASQPDRASAKIQNENVASTDRAHKQRVSQNEDVYADEGFKSSETSTSTEQTPFSKDKISDTTTGAKAEQDTSARQLDPTSVSQPADDPSEPSSDLLTSSTLHDAHASLDKGVKENTRVVSSSPTADTASLRTSATNLSTCAPTLSGFSVMAEEARHGKSDGLPSVVRQHLFTTDYKPPPSISDSSYSKKPWNNKSYSTNRTFEMLSNQPAGRDAGSQWDAISGSDSIGARDSHASSTSLDTIATLFTPDPRPWHPYRFVRRTNPRQVLLFCAGTALTRQQIEASEQMQKTAAVNGTASISLPESADRAADSKSLASYFATTENTNLQGGLGFIYSPCESLCRAMNQSIDLARVEPNFSRRLERPEFPHETTKRRAALRSVIAALEYIPWEEEGFDKIVIATHHGWIVRGIAYEYVDIG